MQGLSGGTPVASFMVWGEALQSQIQKVEQIKGYRSSIYEILSCIHVHKYTLIQISMYSRPHKYIYNKSNQNDYKSKPIYYKR